MRREPPSSALDRAISRDENYVHGILVPWCHLLTRAGHVVRGGLLRLAMSRHKGE